MMSDGEQLAETIRKVGVMIALDFQHTLAAVDPTGEGKHVPGPQTLELARRYVTLAQQPLRARLATSEAERERYRVLLTDVVQSADASLSNRKPSSLIHVPKSVMDSVRVALAASPVSDTDRQGEGS